MRASRQSQPPQATPTEATHQPTDCVHQCMKSCPPPQTRPTGTKNHACCPKTSFWPRSLVPETVLPPARPPRARPPHGGPPPLQGVHLAGSSVPAGSQAHLLPHRTHPAFRSSQKSPDLHSKPRVEVPLALLIFLHPQGGAVPVRENEQAPAVALGPGQCPASNGPAQECHGLRHHACQSHPLPMPWAESLLPGVQVGLGGVGRSGGHPAPMQSSPQLPGPLSGG